MHILSARSEEFVDTVGTFCLRQRDEGSGIELGMCSRGQEAAGERFVFYNAKKSIVRVTKWRKVWTICLMHD